MRLKIKLLAFSFIIIVNVSAQQDFRIAHGETADVLRNPSVVGKESSLSAYVLHRRQWVNLPGSPLSSFLGFEKRLENKFGGAVGLQIVDDRIGALNLQSVKLLYARELRIGVSKIRLGVSLNGNFLKENNGMWITTDESEDPSLSINQNVRSEYLDFAAGFNFVRNDLNIGVSGTRLREVNLKELYWNVKRTYLGWVGYRLQWGNKIALNTTPMCRFMYDGLSQAHVEGRLDTEINNRFWLLLGYRNQESAMSGFGMVLPLGGSKMFVSYSFGYSLNQLAEYNNGNHELMLRFSMDKITTKEKKELKNVRFL